MEAGLSHVDVTPEDRMSLREVLFELDRMNAELHFDGVNLRIRAPRVDLTARLKHGIGERKEQMIALLRNGGRLGRVSIIGLLPRPERIPLSYAQERLWFLEQLGLVGSAYHVATAIRLEGALDVGALERGIGEVERRHESVRTRFAAVDGQGVQVIDEPQPYRLEVVDLSALGPRAGPGEAQRLAQAHAAERFDLATGPLLRVKLLRLGAEHHVMLVNMHHIVSDGWSMGVMVREIGALYGAYAAGLSSPLGDLAVQYADYALWQRDWLAGEVLARQVGYWKERLSGAPAALELPSDRLRPALQSFAGGVVEFSLSERLSAQLGELSRREGATLYMVLLAAFSLLLWRYSGQHDVVVGSPIAGRRYRELEQLIGFFVNTLVLRTDLSGEPSFQALLGRVKETALGAYAHQDLPFEKLVEELKPPRDLSRQPLFQVMFALQNAPTDELRLPGLQLSHLEVERKTTKFDLSLYLCETQRGLRGTIEYAAALFERTTIERLIIHFERLLERIVAAPDNSLPQLVESVEALGVEIVLSSTFTAEPLIDPLRFWCEQIGLTASIRSTGYNQVLQSIFADTPIVHEAHQCHVILLRLEDWGRKEQAGGPSATPSRSDTDQPQAAGRPRTVIRINEIERNVIDFVTKLRFVAGLGKASHLIGVCPASDEVLADARQARHLEAIEAGLLDEIQGLPGVHILPIAATAAALHIDAVHDSYLAKMADIPYTESFFAAIATTVLRVLLSARTPPYKVLITDCDNTLWHGLCGEDGCRGVRITAGRRLLHEFLIKQTGQGTLVGLCSRNNESDVVDVFQSNPDMLLSLDNIVSHRIGWSAKSAAIEEIVDELGLAPESFVFIDDDPAECALMELQRPGVLTLPVPTADDRMSQFIARFWAFDGAGRTAEDRSRTQRYRQERHRGVIRQRSKTLSEFIAGLELRVALREAAKSDAYRIVQMAERTTQFNTAGLHFSHSEVDEILNSASRCCFVVEVADRFGDYGLTGLLLIDRSPSRWTVATFALSCRVLGRDVEFRVIEKVVERAAAAGATDVAFAFVPTTRNVPARQFLEELRNLIGAQHVETTAEFSVAHLGQALKHRDDKAPAATAVAETDPDQATPPVSRGAIDYAAARRRFHRLLATQFGSAKDFVRAPGAALNPPRHVSTEYLAPRTATELTLVSIWQELLKVERIGINDNFFHLGGYSLLATRVAARLRDAFRIELALRTLFEAPTIAELGERIDTICWAAQQASPESAANGPWPDYEQGMI